MLMRRRTQIAACGILLALAAAFVAPSAHAAPRPPNPTNADLAAAGSAKNALAAEVGRLSALVAQSAAKLVQLRATAELAQQKYALAVTRLAQAKQAALQAQIAAVAAQKVVENARKNLKSYVRDSYMAPAVGSSTSGLLTAKDANALLQGGSYSEYISQHRVEVLGEMDRATIAKSNADARARQLLQLQQRLTDEANAAQKVAEQAFQAQQAQQAQLQAQQASYQAHLAFAQLRLATLNNRRASFIAWQQEQERIAAEKARLARIAQEQAAEAARRAAEAAAGGGGGGGGGGASNPPPASAGSWTAAKGQGAVNRAMGALGATYIWAGGNAYGPTDGGCTDPVSPCGTVGFDCSGLVLYGWASQGLFMSHYAASQFSEAGSYHPSPGNFMPGDLLFWGLPGQSDIHHVAMYIGGGNVIQAPYSGSYVQITPWDQVSGDYYGATRPLT